MPVTCATSRTVGGSVGGLTTGKLLIDPSSDATNQRVLSPGICAIQIGAIRLTFENTRWKATGPAGGGRAGARQDGLAGRVSSPKGARTGPASASPPSASVVVPVSTPASSGEA